MTRLIRRTGEHEGLTGQPCFVYFVLFVVKSAFGFPMRTTGLLR